MASLRRSRDTAQEAAQLSRAEAKRLTRRISWRLDGLAGPIAALMPMLREATDRKAYEALGYTNVAEYVEDQLGLAYAADEIEQGITALQRLAGQLRDRSEVS